MKKFKLEEITNYGLYVNINISKRKYFFFSTNEIERYHGKYLCGFCIWKDIHGYVTCFETKEFLNKCLKDYEETNEIKEDILIPIRDII